MEKFTCYTKHKGADISKNKKCTKSNDLRIQSISVTIAEHNKGFHLVYITVIGGDYYQ